MIQDEVHYESCGESNIIEIVNRVSTTNEYVTVTNVYDKSSCDENDSFVNFDNMSDELFDVEESISPNNETLSSELAL